MLPLSLIPPGTSFVSHTLIPFFLYLIKHVKGNIFHLYLWQCILYKYRFQLNINTFLNTYGFIYETENQVGDPEPLRMDSLWRYYFYDDVTLIGVVLLTSDGMFLCPS